jgi:hypothetical protein
MMIMKLFQTATMFFIFSVVSLFGVTATSESTTASLSIVPQFLVNCTTCAFGFYDGCNVCGCSNSSGAIPETSFCAQRYCPKFAYGRPSCNDKTRRPLLVARPARTVSTTVATCVGVPEPAPAFARSATAPAKCKSGPKPPQQALLTSNVHCSTFPNGYSDWCNECLGGADNTAGAYTKRACPTGPIAPPNCNLNLSRDKVIGTCTNRRLWVHFPCP